MALGLVVAEDEHGRQEFGKSAGGRRCRRRDLLCLNKSAPVLRADVALELLLSFILCGTFVDAAARVLLTEGSPELARLSSLISLILLRISSALRCRHTCLPSTTSR